MYYRKDWLLREIESGVRYLLYFLTGKRPFQGGASLGDDFLEEHPAYAQLHQLIRIGEIGRAEDLLFERIESGDDNAAFLVTLFYAEVNRLSDEVLEAADFRREEVLEGLKDACEKLHLYVPFREIPNSTEEES